jgi:hypothetical protein
MNLSALLLEAGRFLVFHCVAVLGAAQDLSKREAWFTMAALKRQLAMFGYASDRQVDHLVARLREVKCLEQCRAPGDGRVRLPASMHKLRTHHTECKRQRITALRSFSELRGAGLRYVRYGT